MALKTVGLQTAIWNNNLRSLLLIALYPLILAALVWLIGALYARMLMMNIPGPAAWQRAANFGTAITLHYAPLLLTIVALWFVISFFGHTRMIRALAHARPITRAEEPQFYNLLENLCISRGLPMPTLNIVETDALNAFSSGIDKTSYAVTVTRGLLQTLQPDELEAVLAHELTHILNNDVRLMMIAIIFVGMLGFLAQMLWSQLRWGFYFRPRRDRDGGNLFLFLLAVEAILWLAYLTTLFTRFALSRHRESMADEGAIELTKNPEALMRALLRLEGRDQIPHAPADISRLCIENSRRSFFGLFDDHPPIAVRVRQIAALTNTPVPELDQPDPPKIKNPWQAPNRHNPWQT